MPQQSVDSATLGELMHAAFRGLRGRWIKQLAPFDLTPHQFRALDAVARSGNDGGLRLKDLADSLRIAPRSATEVVDQLEAKDLVKRGPDPSDRRATLITLTEQGVSMRSEVREDRARQADEYFAVLSDEDRAQLERILAKLAEENPHRHGPRGRD